MKINTKVVLALVFIGAVFFLAINAWVADDAFITLRVVDNFHHGYGLRWNIDERVQVYTHPLWMFVLAIPSWFTGEYYYTTMALNLAVAVVALVIPVFLISRDRLVSILIAILAVSSKAFVDYSSSGLENALSHICIGLFLLLLWKGPRGARGYLWLSLAASLTLLNRMDLGLLLAPVALARLWQDVHEHEESFWKMVLAGAIGQLPLILWMLFSILYYGFPFPNTAYAKLDTGIPAMTMIQHGLYYTFKSLKTDPVTLITEVSAIILCFRRKDAGLIAVAVGMLLYHLYVIKIGGCFMGGRYFTSTFFIALSILAYTAVLSVGQTVAFSSLAILGWMYAFYPQVRGAIDDSYSYKFYDDKGVADEHACYYLWTGITRSITHPQLGDHKWMTKGNRLHEKAEKDGRQVAVFPYIGFIGFYAGPNVHIIDPVGLGDALIARLPQSGHWHVGHYFRNVPDGYIDTVKSGQNLIKDKHVAELYDEIKIMTVDPVFDKPRLKFLLRYWL